MLSPTVTKNITITAMRWFKPGLLKPFCRGEEGKNTLEENHSCLILPGQFKLNKKFM